MKPEDFIKDKALTKRILFLLFSTLLFAFALFHWREIFSIAGSGLQLLSPFFVGIAAAFVLNVLVKLFENHLFSFLNRRGGRIWARCRRAVCVVLAFLVVFLLLGAVVLYVLPELNRSIWVLTEQIPGYLNDFGAWVTVQLEKLNITKEQIDGLKIDWPTILKQAGQVTGNVVGSVANAAMGLFSAVVSLVMSLIFSIYLLIGKEKLIHNTKRVLFAFLPQKTAEKLVEIGTLSNRIFSGFVTGQLTEALILGTLCYVGMSLFHFDYALLISVIICITSLIPVLGAYLGGAVGAFILLLIDPIKALWFLVFLVILQQFEGNVIYPRVVGTSIGLPGIWVLLAILVCGDLMGIPGILLGVPTFSVLYTLLRRATDERLKKRKLMQNGDPAEESVTVSPSEGEP